MATILNIETSTKNCSVSLATNGKVIFLKELNEGSYSHAEKLHPFIVESVKEAQMSIHDIDAIAVSKGPGSYTGLRIGVSAAKGFSYALDIPLISIETLSSLAHSISIEEGYIVPMIDARRMEVYSAVYDNNYNKVREIKAEIIDEDSFKEYAGKKVYFIGDGAEKCKDVITLDTAIFKENLFPSSKEMAQLSYNKYKKNDIEDVAYFEPFYLKDFMIIPQKKKI